VWKWKWSGSHDDESDRVNGRGWDASLSDGGVTEREVHCAP